VESRAAIVLPCEAQPRAALHPLDKDMQLVAEATFPGVSLDTFVEVRRGQASSLGMMTVCCVAAHTRTMQGVV
jgi:hypothetical protein